MKHSRALCRITATILLAASLLGLLALGVSANGSGPLDGPRPERPLDSQGGGDPAPAAKRQPLLKSQTLTSTTPVGEVRYIISKPDDTYLVWDERGEVSQVVDLEALETVIGQLVGELEEEGNQTEINLSPENAAQAAMNQKFQELQESIDDNIGKLNLDEHAHTPDKKDKLNSFNTAYADLKSKVTYANIANFLRCFVRVQGSLAQDDASPLLSVVQSCCSIFLAGLEAEDLSNLDTEVLQKNFDSKDWRDIGGNSDAANQWRALVNSKTVTPDQLVSFMRASTIQVGTSQTKHYAYNITLVMECLVAALNAPRVKPPATDPEKPETPTDPDGTAAPGSVIGGADATIVGTKDDSTTATYIYHAGTISEKYFKQGKHEGWLQAAQVQMEFKPSVMGNGEDVEFKRPPTGWDYTKEPEGTPDPNDPNRLLEDSDSDMVLRHFSRTQQELQQIIQEEKDKTTINSVVLDENGSATLTGNVEGCYFLVVKDTQP